MANKVIWLKDGTDNVYPEHLWETEILSSSSPRIVHHFSKSLHIGILVINTEGSTEQISLNTNIRPRDTFWVAMRDGGYASLGVDGKLITSGVAAYKVGEIVYAT